MADSIDNGTSQTGSSANYDPLSGIAWDTRLSGTAISIYFYPAEQGVKTIYGALQTTGFNEYQEGRFAAALQSFSNVTKLTFEFAATPEEAQLRFFQADIPPIANEQTLLGFAFPPGYTGTSGLEGYNSGAAGWSAAPGGTLEAGGNAFTTLIHEMGHGFGLAHPHDTGGNSTIFPGVVDKFADGGEHDLNQGIYTMMSYRDGWVDAPASADLPQKTDAYGEESTPMAFDVAVLQQKYGVNTTYRIGDDTYALPGENGTGTSYACLWDAGGSNTIRYDGTGNATINLRPATLKWEEGGGGWLSYVQGVRGGYTIANGVSIQTAVSGAGDDLLTGNDGGCLLAANAGQNTVVGGAGNDTVLSAGNDLVAAGGGANLVSLADGIVTVGSAGQDTVVAGMGAATVGVWAGGTDLVFGGSGSLLFLGGAAASTVVGGTGSATLFGGAGGGVLAGGTAGHSLILAGSGAATVIGGGDGDVLFAQGAGQVVQAGTGNETLSGGAATGGNTFFAGGGSDVVGGGGGADTIFAGTGRMTAFGGGGADLFAFRQGMAGQVVIGDFDQAAGDRITLQGYAAGAAQAALAGAQSVGGTTVLTLSDSTRITLVGVGAMQPAAFA